VEAKVSLTTKCNARCRTCPVWTLPGETMSFGNWVKVWGKLMDSPRITHVMLNNTGDIYCEPNHAEYLQLVHRKAGKQVALTTNAVALDMVPDVDNLVISFNGGTKEAYEHTVGVSFDAVRQNIRSMYPALTRLPYVELHCLIWEGNAGSERALVKEWEDFPGRVRISYKYDNQMREDKTLPQYKVERRIPCDYLGKLSIWPDGRVVSCAHDFQGVNDFGNILVDEIDDLVRNPARVSMWAAHERLEFGGLCEKCNYNTPASGRVLYVK